MRVSRTGRALSGFQVSKNITMSVANGLITLRTLAAVNPNPRLEITRKP